VGLAYQLNCALFPVSSQRQCLRSTTVHYLLPLLRTGFVDKLRSRLQVYPQTAKTARFQHFL